MSTNHAPGVPVAALMLPKINLALLMYAKAVHDALLDNPNFPSLNPPLAVFAADIAAFEEAETKTATRVKGAAALRDAKKTRVKQDLFHIRDYVQSVVETSATPASAAALIESAFMSVRKTARRTVPAVSAKNAGVSGAVLLIAKSVAPVAIYHWEYSLDQSTWTPIPGTLRTRTRVSGLLPARTYYFRFHTVTRAGQGDYSQIVSLLVH